MAKQKRKPSIPPVPLEDPYQWFDILYPTNKHDRERIARLILGRGALNPVAPSLLEYIFTRKQGSSLPVCRSIIVEERYRDRDHLQAISSLYIKSFQYVSNECTRIHLFSRRLRMNDLSNLEPKKDSYMGYSVLRPFQQRKIGRTVITRLGYQPSLEFPTCHGTFEVNLGGSKLTVDGPAFMEQDTMVAACASASLWMSTSTIGQRFGLSQYSTAEITQRASEYLASSRPMPSRGLLVEQMVHCLRTMGYEPLLLEVHDQKQAKNDIYSYIESEIPPILLCQLATGGHHTIVGVGHGYQIPVNNPSTTEIDWPGEHPLVFARSSEWVPHLLINDDQRGPFRKLTFITGDLESAIIRAHPEVNIDNLSLDEWVCPVAIDIDTPLTEYSSGEDIANIWGILVPLPPRIMLTSQEAERKSARLIRFWHWLHGIPLPQDLVLRTYALPSNEYKSRIESSGMDVFVRRMLRGKPMPRWIWVTEISSIASYNATDPRNWLINGTVIIDATSNAFTPDFLAFHYIIEGYSYVATMMPEHEDAEQALSRYWYSQSDSKYSGFIR